MQNICVRGVMQNICVKGIVQNVSNIIQIICVKV